jgi:hypothetical protein
MPYHSPGIPSTTLKDVIEKTTTRRLEHFLPRTLRWLRTRVPVLFPSHTGVIEKTTQSEDPSVFSPTHGSQD